MINPRSTSLVGTQHAAPYLAQTFTVITLFSATSATSAPSALNPVQPQTKSQPFSNPDL